MIAQVSKEQLDYMVSLGIPADWLLMRRNLMLWKLPYNIMSPLVYQPRTGFVRSGSEFPSN
ncbi:MAG: hypothetical protein IPH59_10315 [bacterium]|nr:hypothetical protein [bacterium]